MKPGDSIFDWWSLAHIVGFALFSYYLESRRRTPWTRHALYTAAITTGWEAFEAYSQKEHPEKWYGNRYGDVACNFFGSALGVWLARR